MVIYLTLATSNDQFITNHSCCIYTGSRLKEFFTLMFACKKSKNILTQQLRLPIIYTYWAKMTKLPAIKLTWYAGFVATLYDSKAFTNAFTSKPSIHQQSQFQYHISRTLRKLCLFSQRLLANVTETNGSFSSGFHMFNTRYLTLVQRIYFYVDCSYHNNKFLLTYVNVVVLFISLHSREYFNGFN